ncbi:MAG TPA: WbqC family protein [Pyrinomonadaceae bacterium]|nr:WbqC family protein [Pyrinomonadaceae bacterium]
MIVSIHQPHFLPWLGYFNKVLHSDVFVWLDSVQYRKNYFQNRTRITNLQGQPMWLTLGVHAKLGTPINHVSIADPRWRHRMLKTVEQRYCKTSYFSTCWPLLSAALRDAPDTLSEINYRTFETVLDLIAATGFRVVRSSEMEAETDDPTARLVQLCIQLDASHYIAGQGGKNYLRVGEFERHGIKVIWQEFDPNSVVYTQQSRPFVAGLSVIDCLFNAGPEQTKELILNAWKPKLETAPGLIADRALING